MMLAERTAEIAPPASGDARAAAEPPAAIELDFRSGTRTVYPLPATTGGRRRHHGARGTGATEPAGSPALPEVVWGADTRKLVRATAAYPNSAVTKMFVDFSDTGGGCSGALVSPWHVLTAGHCVLHPDFGWAQRIEVVPGMDGLGGNEAPYGSAEVVTATVLDGWANDFLPDYDMAILELDRPIGETAGYFGYASASDTSLFHRKLRTAGYPGDKCGGLCMYAGKGPVSAVSDTAVFYGIDTFEGQSGSPVYQARPKGYYVVGVHRGLCSQVSGRNCAARINADRMLWLLQHTR